MLIYNVDDEVVVVVQVINKVGVQEGFSKEDEKVVYILYKCVYIYMYLFGVLSNEDYFL